MHLEFRSVVLLVQQLQGAQRLGAQPERVRVPPMPEGAAQTGEKPVPFAFAAPGLDQLPRQPRPRSPDRSALHADAVRQQAESEPPDSGPGRYGPPGVQAQPELPTRFLQVPRLITERVAVLPEQQHVVHVAKIPANPKAIRRPVIDRREVSIREVLAGQVSYGEPDGTLERREQAVAGEVEPGRGDGPDSGFEYEPAHPERPLAVNVASEHPQEQLVIDRGEELLHIEMHRIRIGSRPGRGDAHRRVRALAVTAGERSVDEVSVDEGADGRAEGLVDDAVGEGGSGDDSRLGVGNPVPGCAARPPRPGPEFPAESEHCGLEVEQSACDAGAVPLAPGGAERS